MKSHERTRPEIYARNSTKALLTSETNQYTSLKIFRRNSLAEEYIYITRSCENMSVKRKTTAYSNKPNWNPWFLS